MMLMTYMPASTANDVQSTNLSHSRTIARRTPTKGSEDSGEVQARWLCDTLEGLPS